VNTTGNKDKIECVMVAPVLLDVSVTDCLLLKSRGATVASPSVDIRHRRRDACRRSAWSDTDALIDDTDDEMATPTYDV